MTLAARDLRPVAYDAHRRELKLLDQRRLPDAEKWLGLSEVEPIAEAIETLAVRGAPAIGCAAALGMAVLAQRMSSAAVPGGCSEFHAAYRQAHERLAATRPTAVNLFHGLDALRSRLGELSEAPIDELRASLLACAQTYLAEELQRCTDLSEHGAPLLPDSGGVLTHCNAGALATAGLGTALGVIYRARELGKKFTVYADETRPLLQGARLTAWELQRCGVPVRVLTDSMAGWMMARGVIHAVIVGADRIAANGDAANKIGTYALAVLARHHDIPFYVAAPSSTIDSHLADGSAIPIEERSPEEVRRHGGVCMTPAGTEVVNPAFDVTPAELITRIVTERGHFAPSALPA